MERVRRRGIRDEVKKQFDAGFLAVAKYPQWVANIVPVPKKDGKVRMCVDYRDRSSRNHRVATRTFPAPATPNPLPKLPTRSRNRF